MRARGAGPGAIRPVAVIVTVMAEHMPDIPREVRQRLHRWRFPEEKEWRFEDLPESGHVEVLTTVYESGPVVRPVREPAEWSVLAVAPFVVQRQRDAREW